MRFGYLLSTIKENKQQNIINTMLPKLLIVGWTYKTIRKTITNKNKNIVHLLMLSPQNDFPKADKSRIPPNTTNALGNGAASLLLPNFNRPLMKQI